MAKILVVDDDQDVVEGCRIYLENAGHEVMGANTREDGMQAVEDFKPDLVILDVMMEQADDGVFMAQELRRNNFKAPILMITGVGKVTGLNIGKDNEMVPVDDFVEKPFDPKLLIEKVNSLLG